MAKNNLTTRSPLVRQPAVEGPDAVYNRLDRCVDAFVDGRYIGSHNTDQEALIAARKTYFDILESDVYTSADQAADMADLADIAELVDALAAKLGTGDLEYVREVLSGGFRKVCADWDAGYYRLVEMPRAAICQNCGKDRPLVYGLCGWCRLMTRTDAQYCEVA